MLLENQIIYRNRRLLKGYRFTSIFPYDEYFHEFKINQDKFLINALHLKAEQPKGLIFFMHGSFKHLQFHIPLCKEFLLNDFDVCLFDYPKYGKSRGKLHEQLLYKIADKILHLTLKNERSEEVLYKRLILCGRSLGTAIAAHTALHTQAERLLLMTPYFNMKELIQLHLKRNDLPRLTQTFPNNQYLPKVQMPVTILHGDKDKLIPLAFAQRLTPLLKTNDEFVIIKDANHFNLHQQDQYKKHIKKLLS